MRFPWGTDLRTAYVHRGIRLFNEKNCIRLEDVYKYISSNIRLRWFYLRSDFQTVSIHGIFVNFRLTETITLMSIGYHSEFTVQLPLTYGYDFSEAHYISIIIKFLRLHSENHYFLDMFQKVISSQHFFKTRREFIQQCHFKRWLQMIKGKNNVYRSKDGCLLSHGVCCRFTVPK